MSWPAKMMGIADIFEALTAADRPYKKAKTLSESLAIMDRMAKEGHIDRNRLPKPIEVWNYPPPPRSGSLREQPPKPHREETAMNAPTDYLQAEFESLVPPALPVDRRGFLVTALGAGFALAVQP
jgi:hypothetical protein